MNTCLLIDKMCEAAHWPDQMYVDEPCVGSWQHLKRTPKGWKRMLMTWKDAWEYKLGIIELGFEGRVQPTAGRLRNMGNQLQDVWHKPELTISNVKSWYNKFTNKFLGCKSQKTAVLESLQTDKYINTAFWWHTKWERRWKQAVQPTSLQVFEMKCPLAINSFGVIWCLLVSHDCWH